MLNRAIFSARHGHYVRDFVEEARMWSVTMPQSEGTTPSGDSDNSMSSDTSTSQSPGKFDMSALAFSKSDVVLVGRLHIVLAGSEYVFGDIVTEDGCFS